MDDARQMELDLLCGVLDALACPVVLLNRSGSPAYSSTHPCPIVLENVDFVELASVRAALDGQPARTERVILHAGTSSAEGLLEVRPVRVLDRVVGALAMFYPDAAPSALTTDALPTQSDAMVAVWERLHRLSLLDSVVLFLGEDGVGSPDFAQALHRLSAQKDEPFETAGPECEPDELLRLAERAGVLFLRDIDLWPSALLDTVRRLLGIDAETRLLPETCRVMASAGLGFERSAADGDFPYDLFVRLNVLPVCIPALRTRPEDIAPMAEALLHGLSQQANKDISGFSRQALEVMRHYAWPGNIAELRSACAFAVETCPGGLVLATHLPMGAQEGMGALQQMREAYTQEQLSAMLMAYGTSVEAKRKIAAELGIGLSTLYRILARRGRGD